MDMQVFLEFLVVFTVCILPQIAAALFILHDPDYTKRWSPGERTVLGWITHSAAILLVVYIAYNQPTGPAALGLRLPKGVRLITLFVGGLTTLYLVALSFSDRLRSQKVREEREVIRKAVFKAGGFSNPQGFRSRTAFLGSIWLGVIAEDLVFRGYLVLGLGTQTGLLWPWVLLSLLLSVAVHLYQGLNWRIMLSQALFALIFIIAVLVTGNVFAAILPHLVYDTIWLLRGWAKSPAQELAQIEAAG
jgi:membrane protease YdiL (CAAX protease family)